MDNATHTYKGKLVRLLELTYESNGWQYGTIEMINKQGRLQRQTIQVRNLEPIYKHFLPGTQIAYIPTHACGNIKHRDVQFGFVTSERGNAHFCRYWLKDHPGELRTTANSELTPTMLLVEHKSVDQSVVDEQLAQIELPKPKGIFCKVCEDLILFSEMKPWRKDDETVDLLCPGCDSTLVKGE